MRSFTDRKIDTMDANGHVDRLETPLMAGFRAGMSSCGVIGRKLGKMYNVPSDRPDRIETLIRAIDRAIGRSR